MPKPDPNVCTELELRFVDAYVANGGNGAAAAREAGYKGGPKGDGFKVRASKLLDRHRVRDAVERRRAEVRKLAEDADRLVRERKLAEIIEKRAEVLLGPIADAHTRQRFWSAVMMGEGAGAGATLYERLRASELLGRAQGDFVHENEPTTPVVVAASGGTKVEIVLVHNNRGPLPPSSPIAELPADATPRKP